MTAIISPCGRYRYRLERDGHGVGKTVVIMVNPSTADATEDDATIRKLKGFGMVNNWGRIIVGNLFAYRATDIRELARCDDPVGPENDVHLRLMIAEADRVIAAWGALDTKLPKHLRSRWQDVADMVPERLDPIFSIGPSSQSGHPCHPLMLPYSRPIIPWSLNYEHL